MTHESQSSSSASAQMVASVDDLLIEIFLRVPMKSLIRFKSVSKHWQSLISDPGFGILRNPNPNPATNLILKIPTGNQRRPNDRMESKPVPYAYIVSFDTGRQIRTLKMIDESWPYDTTTIMSSCNGLILMRADYENFGGGVTYYVCNPTTNARFKLPQIPDWSRGMCLAFDPSNSPHYKVVCALTGFTNTMIMQYQFTVYSSETGCWRKSRVEPFKANVHFDRGVYWNGALHWVSCDKTEKSIFFDPDDDRMYQEMMPTPLVPDNENNISSIYYFGESCGHLHYAVGCWSSCSEIEFDVYEMRRDYSEWFVKHRIRDPCYSVGNRFVNHITYLCAVVRGKTTHHDDSYSVLLIGGTLVRYNFLSETRETICQVKGTPLEQCAPHVCLPLQHAESLCSL